MGYSSLQSVEDEAVQAKLIPEYGRHTLFPIKLSCIQGVGKPRSGLPGCSHFNRFEVLVRNMYAYIRTYMYPGNSKIKGVSDWVVTVVDANHAIIKIYATHSVRVVMLTLRMRGRNREKAEGIRYESGSVLSQRTSVAE